MAYSVDARRLVLDYIEKGHTYEEAHLELGIAISTIKEWKKLFKETGSLEMRPVERSTRKFHSRELEVYVNEHPDATLDEIAIHFDGSISGAFNALEREKITFKKRALLHRT